MKNIMKRAWEIAREGQSKFGGKVSDYLSESLKMAWAEAKNQDNEVVAIKDWFIRKNFNQHEAYAISVADYIKVARETEKAYYLEIVTEFGNIKTWAPKSVCMNREQFNAEFEAQQTRFNKGLERNLQLLEEAKSLGIKGVRKGMKTKTLERKIAEFKTA